MDNRSWHFVYLLNKWQWTQHCYSFRERDFYLIFFEWLNSCFPKFKVLYKNLLFICNIIQIKVLSINMSGWHYLYRYSVAYHIVSFDDTRLLTWQVFISNNTFCIHHYKVGYSSFVKVKEAFKLKSSSHLTSEKLISPLSRIKTGFKKPTFYSILRV